MYNGLTLVEVLVVCSLLGLLSLTVVTHWSPPQKTDAFVSAWEREEQCLRMRARFESGLMVQLLDNQIHIPASAVDHASKLALPDTFRVQTVSGEHLESIEFGSDGTTIDYRLQSEDGIIHICGLTGVFISIKNNNFKAEVEDKKIGDNELR